MQQYLTIDFVIASVSVASVAVGITLWAVYNFQSKKDARDQEERLSNRIDSLSTEIDQLKGGVSRVAVDVAYIRGRLEPQTGVNLNSPR